MTDEQVGVINAASLLRTASAELHAVMNFIGRDVIEEVGTARFMARKDRLEIMARAQPALENLVMMLTEMRHRFAGLTDRGILTGSSDADFVKWAAGVLENQPREDFERADGTLDFRAAKIARDAKRMLVRQF